jgi:hypothetical protein
MKAIKQDSKTKYNWLRKIQLIDFHSLTPNRTLKKK